MAKYTLLEMVQIILSDMDAEEVNAIGDTSESTQVAWIIRDTFYNIVSNRQIPELRKLIKLTSLSNSSYPTHFRYPDNTQGITNVWYEDVNGDYQEIKYLDPVDFLARVDGIEANYTEVLDISGGTKLRIVNNEDPSFYTSFDDTHIVMNSHDSSVDTTLTEAKSRAFGTVVPNFTITDSFTPEIDHNYFPLLLAESKSVAMSLLTGGSDPKIEQAARRQRVRVQNDKYNTVIKRGISHYGR